MKTENNQQFGVGLEAEGFIVNSTGKGIEEVAGMPTSEWIMQRLKDTKPGILANLSLEQASVMLEVKSDVCADELMAIKQILELRLWWMRLKELCMEDLLKENNGHRDFSGKSRLDRAIGLLTQVKSPQFISRGFAKTMDIVVPPFFADEESMKKWMCAHSDVDDFKDAHCKNEHAVTAKIKRDGFWAVETRIFDATNDELNMRKLVRFNSELLREALTS